MMAQWVSTMNDSGWGQLAILVTTLITLAYNLYREKRDRRWKQEDMERLAKARADAKRETEAAALRVAGEVIRVEARAAQQRGLMLDRIDEHAKVSARKLDENTQISIDAFREANNVNEKIAAIARQASALKPTASEIKQTGEDTNARVKHLEEKLDEEPT